MQALDIVTGDGTFLLGDELTLADVSVYAQLKWMREVPEGKRAIVEFSAVGDWMARVEAATR